MLDKIDQQIEHPRLEPHQPPGLAKLIVLWVERVVVKGVTHRLSPSSHALGRCDAGPPGPPHHWPPLPPACRAAAILQPILSQPSANLQPILKQSRGLYRNLLDVDNIEPEDVDAYRGYVS